MSTLEERKRLSEAARALHAAGWEHVENPSDINAPILYEHPLFYGSQMHPLDAVRYIEYTNALTAEQQHAQPLDNAKSAYRGDEAPMWITTGAKSDVMRGVYASENNHNYSQEVAAFRADVAEYEEWHGPASNKKILVFALIALPFLVYIWFTILQKVP